MHTSNFVVQNRDIGFFDESSAVRRRGTLRPGSFRSGRLKRLFCGLACFLVAGCAVGGYRVDDRNFAIDTYRPKSNELRLAEARVRSYQGRNPAGSKSAPPYLAVAAGTILPSEVQNLWPKLISAETSAGVLAHGGEDLAYHDFLLHGVLIFDARTGRLANDFGYVTAETPQLGRIARFGTCYARFIGTGH
ncbi:MAG: hypothetical protein JO015_15245 [Verrucomicrobia bacterium]|nr:hypothetical protein [Verrucomicrobiota bacterium]